MNETSYSIRFNYSKLTHYYVLCCNMFLYIMISERNIVHLFQLEYKHSSPKHCMLS
jgi:hypothetical protein